MRGTRNDPAPLGSLPPFLSPSPCPPWPPPSFLTSHQAPPQAPFPEITGWGMLSPSLCGPGGPQHPHPEDLSPHSKQRRPWPGWTARRWAVQEIADRFPWDRGPTAMNTSGSFASPKANSLLSESCLEHGCSSPLSRVHLPPPPPSASSSSWAQALVFQNSLGGMPGPVSRAKSLCP